MNRHVLARKERGKLAREEEWLLAVESALRPPHPIGRVSVEHPETPVFRVARLIERARNIAPGITAAQLDVEIGHITVPSPPSSPEQVATR